MRFYYISFRLLQQTISQNFDPLYEPEISDRNIEVHVTTGQKNQISSMGTLMKIDNHFSFHSLQVRLKHFHI